MSREITDPEKNLEKAINFVGCLLMVLGAIAGCVFTLLFLN